MEIFKKLTIILLGFILFLAGFLRLYHLGSNPPSLYWDEVALGYDAYSILQTGKDHHGQSFPLVAFQSYGDWKPSGYFYALIPFIALFDLSELTVRLPSAMMGILSVLGIFGLTLTLQQNNANTSVKQRTIVALLSALFLALVPWHVLVSRVGFETNLALGFVILASWLFFTGVNNLDNNKKYLILLSTILFSLSLYTYHANRIFVPLFGLFLGIYYFKKLLQVKLITLLSIITVVLVGLPIALQLSEPVISQRFSETSAFTDLQPIIESNAAIARDGGGVVAKVIHHRFWYYGSIFAQNYLSHFSPEFLFITGDENDRHSVSLVGQLYWIQLPLIIAGLIFMFRLKVWWLVPIVIWLLISPVPAGVTKAAPHALRSLPMVIPLSILSAYGLVMLLKAIQSLTVTFPQKLSYVTFFQRAWQHRTVIVFSSLMLYVSTEATRFWHYYNTFYPKKTSQYWQYGYKEVVDYISGHKGQFEKVIVTRDQGRPAMYYWFYTKTDPNKVQEADSVVPKDQGEHLQFENIAFGGPFLGDTSKSLVVSVSQLPKGELKNIVSFKDGTPAFYIYEVQ